MSVSSDLYAALDLGSNSFHLLIADFSGAKMRIVDRHKEMVRFAAGLDEHDRLDDATQQRALESLSRMAERLHNIPPHHIRVVGTNTLRAASNASTFLQKAEEMLGVPINIISGTEEARLIYLGVACDFSPAYRRRLVIDIGGGSTEIVIGQDRPTLLKSLPMGCVSSSRRYFSQGDISGSAFDKAVARAQQELAPHIDTLNGQWDEAVGSSGTIRAIGKIATLNQWSDDGAITPEALAHMASALLKAKRVGQLKLEGLSSNRTEVFPGGLAILTALMQELGIERLIPSEYALREGVIHDLAGRFQHRDIRISTIAYFQKQYQVDEVHAERIASLALHWHKQVCDDVDHDYQEAANLLRWAAQLHEIGLSIAHGSFHKHGAYILSHADMPGFSRQEQANLSFLVLNQRRKPKQPDPVYGLSPNWLLVSLLRLACIFYRRRQPRPLPEGMQITANTQTLTLTVPEAWYRSNPLSAADLADEIQLMKIVDFELIIQTC